MHDVVPAGHEIHVHDHKLMLTRVNAVIQVTRTAVGVKPIVRIMSATLAHIRRRTHVAVDVLTGFVMDTTMSAKKRKRLPNTMHARIQDIRTNYRRSIAWG